MKFDIKQLVVFIEVVDHASFSKAADALGVAQASVSERIANLEKAVGARLLNRMGRKVELTSTGAFLLERAREIVALKKKTDLELGALLGVDTGEIRIGGSTAPGEYILPMWMGRFAREYPGVRLSLEIQDSQKTTDKIIAGDLELGVIGRRETDTNLLVKKVGSDEIILVVDPNHKWATRRTPIVIAQLSGENWVVRERGSATRAIAERMLNKGNPDGPTRKNILAELGSATAVKEAVAAGLGIALISKLTVAKELKAGTLNKVGIKKFSAPRNFYLVREKRRVLSPAATAFWDFILEVSNQ